MMTLLESYTGTFRCFEMIYVCIIKKTIYTSPKKRKANISKYKLDSSTKARKQGGLEIIAIMS